MASTAVRAEFEPTLAVGAISTDNVTLSRTNAEAAKVLVLRPGFTYTRESENLIADVAYRMDAYHYQERNENWIHNVLDAAVSVGMVPDRLFLDLGGSRTQAIIDPEGTIPFDNLAIIDNRVDRDDIYGGLSFQTPVGEMIVANGIVRRTFVSYADPLATVGGLDDYESDEVGLSLDNYQKGVGLSWATRYTYQAVDSSLPFAASFDYQQLYVELGYWVNPGTRLFVVAGKESPWNQPLEDGLKDTFWEAGLAREVGERFQAEFAIGDRSFGSSWRGELEYDFPRGSTALSYNETPTTSANDRFSVGGLLSPEDPDDYLFRAGSAERYISKRLAWNLLLDWERYNFAVSLYDESRDNRSGGSGLPLADEHQSGAYVSAAWRIGVRTELFLTTLRASSEFASGEDRDIASLAGGASYGLGQRMRLSLELELREQTSAQTLTLNYREKLASVILAFTF
jgi:uncharacterized protein (PEP-CTERM system associated)